MRNQSGSIQSNGIPFGLSIVGWRRPNATGFVCIFVFGNDAQTN